MTYKVMIDGLCFNKGMDLNTARLEARAALRGDADSDDDATIINEDTNQPIERVVLAFEVYKLD